MFPKGATLSPQLLEWLNPLWERVNILKKENFLTLLREGYGIVKHGDKLHYDPYKVAKLILENDFDQVVNFLKAKGVSVDVLGAEALAKKLAQIDNTLRRQRNEYFVAELAARFVPKVSQKNLNSFPVRFLYSYYYWLQNT